MRELNFSKFSPITYYLSALFQTKIGILYIYANRGGNYCHPQYHQGIYQPYNVFIFEFLYEKRISQKSFRIHSIYLHSNCIFIKKS